MHQALDKENNRQGLPSAGTTPKYISNRETRTITSFPIKWLATGLTFSAVVLLAMLWSAYDSFRNITTEQLRNLRLQELSGQIIHLDEVLTMSAHMAVATGDLKWEQRYRQAEPQLETAIKTSVQLASLSESAEAPKQTDAANLKLVDMENQAFTLVRAGQADLANSILFGEAYTTQKEIYAEGIHSLVNNIQEDLSKNLRAKRNQAFFIISATLLSIVLLFITWLLVWGKLHRWRTDQATNVAALEKAENTLQIYNDELEKRVKERTKELSDANIIVQNSPTILYRLRGEPSFPLMYISSNIAKYGHDAAQLIASNNWANEIIHPDDQDKVGTTMARTLAKDAQDDSIAFRLCTGDGTFRWVETRYILIRNKKGRLIEIEGIIFDITERTLAERKLRDYNSKLVSSNRALKIAQEQLIHSAKMASIGQITAGLAHEINQPLGAIHLNTELIHTIANEENYIQKDELTPIYNKIHHQITRINKLIQHMRIFCRDGKLLELEETDIRSLIDDSLVLFLQRFQLNNIQLVKEFTSDIPEIECNKINIEQVLTNLLMNAEHALAYSVRKAIILRVYVKENCVVVEVEDNGSGISKENLNKIFDPFFTTKKTGEGTGLGMSISYGIIQSHNGNLTVKSEVGKGTTFTLSLPIKQGQIVKLDEPASLQGISR